MILDNIAMFVGLVALAISVWALIRKTNDHLLIILSIAVMLWGVHYFMMGSVVGGTMHVIAALGIFIADRMGRLSLKFRTLTATGFVALNILAGAIWWSGPWDAYAIAAAPVLVYSQFCLKGARMRMGFMTGEAIMFFYATALGSMPGMAVSLINIAAGVAGLIRIMMDRRKRDCPPP
jgi:hypothetical protein